MVEVWTHAAPVPHAIAAEAQLAEAQGWDGLGVPDSQNRSGDAYVALAMAATVTERIGLATAVTNSITRMAAATAAAIASVDRIAEGRAVLGIGRGDSAVADLGRAPARVAQFETYLRHLQAYLRGEAVPLRRARGIGGTAGGRAAPGRCGAGEPDSLAGRRTQGPRRGCRERTPDVQAGRPACGPADVRARADAERIAWASASPGRRGRPLDSTPMESPLAHT